MRKLLAAATILALATPLAAAAPPNTPAAPCNGTILSIGPFYIDDRGGSGIWIYQESNERSGLQSGGSIGFLSDPCFGPPPPADTLLAFSPVGI